jgi:poly-gamma-glutamate synthesis protein (capsule biosynthesis protein)
LANNHILDQGVDGYLKTAKVLQDFKLAGIGKWDEAYRLSFIDKNGVKVGILNFCEMQFGMLSDEWTQDGESIGCAWVNHVKVNQLIAKSAQEVDYLVAIVHAGLEMIDVPLPEWRDRYREMIYLGCDAIIAHHPHIVQGFDIYNGKPICYSLGNFCFSGGVAHNSKEWNTGALAILELGADGINLTLKGCQLIDKHLSLVESDVWKQKIDFLCQQLKEDYYMARINDSCKLMMRDYWELFAMGGLFSPKAVSLKNLARIPLHKYDYIHLINNMQCESHRWCICRALRNEKSI